jgi:hypothetical protein
LNSGLDAYKAGIPLLEPHLQHFALVILEMESHKLFFQACLELDPPDHSIPSS